MRGTRKQQNWAEQIRDEMTAAAPEFKDGLNHINDAKWFINNRVAKPGLSMATWVGVLVEAYYNGIRVADAKGFASLEGSQKQIAWAEEIRQRFVDMAVIEKYEAEAKRKSKTEERFAAVIEVLKAQTSAKWYIDNRDVYSVFDLAELSSSKSK